MMQRLSSIILLASCALPHLATAIPYSTKTAAGKQLASRADITDAVSSGAATTVINGGVFGGVATQSISGNGTGNSTNGVPMLPSQVFYTFPDNYQPENIKQRSNGALLVTINTHPIVYQVDPTKNQSGAVLFNLTGYTSLFGIVESGTPDVFFFIANNFTGNPDFWGIEGSNSIWMVDMRNISATLDDAAIQKLNMTSKVRKVIDVPEAQLLDGLTLLNAQLNYLLTGDAQTGTLWLIDVPSRVANKVYQNEILAGTSSARNESLAHVGINGLKFNDKRTDNQLYFTNTAKGQLWMMPVDPTNPAPPIRDPVLLEDLGLNTYLDDFSLDAKGNAYICEPLKGVRFRSAGTTPGQDSVPTVAMFNANSNTFGRLQTDKCYLYLTINGRVNKDSPAPMNEPPSLARVDTTPMGVCNYLLNPVQQASPGSSPGTEGGG